MEKDVVDYVRELFVKEPHIALYYQMFLERMLEKMKTKCTRPLCDHKMSDHYLADNEFTHCCSYNCPCLKFQ